MTGTPDTFSLRITLGNDAMRTRLDIADALADTAQRIRDHQYGAGTEGPVRDFNGNRVGTFSMPADLES